MTFAGNARLKAEALAAATDCWRSRTTWSRGRRARGCPGVFSARWSGTRAGLAAPRTAKDRANVTLLLEQLADVPAQHRGAAFVCAAVLAIPGEEIATCEGRVEEAGLRAAGR